MTEKKPIFVIIDTETGGLDPKTTALLSSAYIVVDEDLKVHDARYEVCRPVADVTEENCTDGALNVNGFKRELIAKRSFTEVQVANRLQKYFAQLEKVFDIYWVGQNASFDIGYFDIYATNPFPKYSVIDTKNTIAKLRRAKNRPHKSNAMGQFIKDFPEAVELANDLNMSIFGVDGEHHDARFDVCMCLAILHLEKGL